MKLILKRTIHPSGPPSRPYSPALQSGVRRGWRVRTLPFQYVMQQHGSSPLFFSDGSDGLTSSFFGGVASAKGLSSVILLRLLGRASFAAYVALLAFFCWCIFENGCGGYPFLFCCCLWEEDGEFYAEALPVTKKTSLQFVLVFSFYVKDAVVMSTVVLYIVIFFI